MKLRILFLFFVACCLNLLHGQQVLYINEKPLTRYYYYLLEHNQFAKQHSLMCEKPNFEIRLKKYLDNTETITYKLGLNKRISQNLLIEYKKILDKYYINDIRLYAIYNAIDVVFNAQSLAEKDGIFLRLSFPFDIPKSWYNKF